MSLVLKIIGNERQGYQAEFCRPPDSPFCVSRSFARHADCKDALARFVFDLQQDDFIVVDGGGGKISVTTAANVTRLPGRAPSWEVTCFDGVVLQVSGENFPCVAGAVVGFCDEQVIIGAAAFDIVRKITNRPPVYVLRPKKAEPVKKKK